MELEHTDESQVAKTLRFWDVVFGITVALTIGSVVGFFASVWVEKRFPNWEASIGQRNAAGLFGLCVVVMIFSAVRRTYLKNQESPNVPASKD